MGDTRETQLEEKLQKVNLLIKFCKHLLRPTVYADCTGVDSNVTPTKGFCLRLVLYIAEDDAWVISVKPTQILTPFELDVGPR